MGMRTTETPLSFSNDHSVDQPTAEASPYDRLARVLDKMYATLVARFDASSRYMTIVTRPPIVCLRPSISMELVLNSFRVTTVRKFASGTCVYNTTREHELQHVVVSQAVLSRVAEVIRKEIGSECSDQLHFGGPDRIAAGLQTTFTRHWLPCV